MSLVRTTKFMKFRKSGYFSSGYRKAGNLKLHSSQRVLGGEIQRLPVVAAERHVGGCSMTMDDATEFLTIAVENVDSTRPTTVDVSSGINLHTVWHARVCSAQVSKDTATLSGNRTIGQHVE